MSRQVLVFILLLCYCQSVGALENLAYHEKYTFSPKPNYPLCTDSSDAVQLTDGRKSGSQWRDKSTVGWNKPEPDVEIVIDLAQNYAIDEVRIYTVGGGIATVEFPEFAAILLSKDGRRFKFAGIVSSKELENIRGFGYRGVPRTLTVGNINAEGRYVKIVMRPKGPTLFVDEVEVFGQSMDDIGNRRLRDNLEIFETDNELLSRIDDYFQLQEDLNITSNTVKEIRLKYSGKTQTSNLSGLEVSSKSINFPTDRIYSRKEILDVKKQIGKIRAGIYQVENQKLFVCLPANPMDVVFEKDMPRLENPGPIIVHIWQNEYESAAFNIINCSDTPLEMAVSVSPLTSSTGQRFESDETFTVRRAVYVYGSQIGSIADALISQNGRPFRMTSGEITQIWLTIFNPELTAGSYEGAIAISAKTDKGRTIQVQTLPVIIKVHEKRFPEKIALKTCNWAYYKVGSTHEMAEDLYSHHTNVYVVPAQDLPFPRFSTDPLGLVKEPNYARLDNVLWMHKYAQTFLIGLNFSIEKKDFGRFGDVRWMTPDWKKVFSSWLEELAKHLKDHNVGYDTFVLYPFDESIADDYYELAKLVKQIDPKIRLYANSFGKGPKEFMRFNELIDVWCLQDSHCIRHPDWFETIKSFKKEVWTYECLRPMKAKKPYSYYRLLPWRAFQRGQTGAGFWIYYYGLNFEPGAVPWDDTLRPLGFSGVVYGAKAGPMPCNGEKIVPSRRWEAWREGVEDYQYLYELQQAIDKIKTKDPQMAKLGQQTLDEQVSRVLNHPNDSRIVYNAREILTQTLLKLSSQAD